MKKVLEILKNLLKNVGGFFKNIGKGIVDFLVSKLGFLKKLTGKFGKKNKKESSAEEVEYFTSEADVQRVADAAKKSGERTLGMVIMVAGCAVVLVLSVVMCVINCNLSYDLAERYIEEEIQSGINAYQIAVKEKVDIIHLEAQGVALSSDIYTGTMQMGTRKNLLEQKAVNSSYTDFSIAKKDGTTYNETDISDREFFKEAMGGATYISSPLVRETDGSVVFMCAAKITNILFDGAAYGAVELSTFTDLLNTLKIGEESSAFLLDKHGAILAHPNDSYVRNMKTFAVLAEEEGKAFKGAADISAKMIAGETGIETINYMGQECYVGYIPVGNTENWSVALVIPSAAAMTALNKSIVSNILILIVLLLLGAVVFMIIANIISKPINLISERLGLLAEGDLYSPIPKVKSEISETKMLMESLTGVTNNLSSITTDIDRVLGGLAKKNLTIRPETEYRGDFRSIRTSLITISNSLFSIVRSLEKVSGDVSSGSNQILSSSENLANSTIQQSSSLDALGENLTQISERIEANVGVTNKAANLVSETVERANASTDKMAQMIESMSEISKTSEQIDIIIQTIDDIAFQTNILALNAAVEAAKAGEAGKGFAVVADEVRNLASKSAEAASNTAKLISESIEAVRKGEGIADETAVALNDIVRNIDQINEYMSEIATASDEQAQRISGINESMTVISDLTQNTSATSEECAAASHEFSSHSTILQSIVDEFRMS